MKKVLISCILVLPIFANTVSLGDSYNKALNYESKVQSYKYQVMAKKEDITQSRARLYPQIELKSSATERHYKLNYGETNRNEKYYTVTLSGSLPIYHPENYNYIAQSKIKYNFSNLYLKQLKQELAFNVTDAYMLILRANNSLFVAEAYLEANEIRYNQINKMYEKNLANKMDLLESKVTYEQSKVKVNSEKHNLYLAKFKFKNLTGLKDVEVKKINLEKIDLSNLPVAFKKSDLLTDSLEIKKSNLSIKIMEKEIENATYGHYPKVDLSGSLSKYDTNSIYTDYKHESTVMLNFKLPIYQGGAVESQITKNRYLLSASQEDLQDTTRNILSQYEEFMINLNNSKENIKLYKEAIESAELYLHAVNKGYENGLKNLIDVEDAKTKLYETKFKLIDSVYQYIKSYTSLLNLNGNFDESKIVQLDKILFDDAM